MCTPVLKGHEEVKLELGFAFFRWDLAHLESRDWE